MADYRHDDDRTLPGGPGMNRTPETDPEHLIPEHTHAAAPGTIGASSTSDDPDVVRGEIERTRQRMSSTIDEIEGALLRKKGEIQDRLDFAAPVRQRPWAFAAGVFGTGLALGFLTGGGSRSDDDGDREYVKIPRTLLEGIGVEEAGSSGNTAGNGLGAGDWELRTRELMQVVARQEEEIRDLRAVVYGRDDDLDALANAEIGAPESIGEVEIEDEWDEDWNFSDQGDDFQDFEALGMEAEDEGGFSLGKPLAGVIAAGVAGIVGGLAKKLIDNRGSDELDVEIDLEPRPPASVVDDRAHRYTARGTADVREALAATETEPYQPTGRTRMERERERHYEGTLRPPQYGEPLEVEVELDQAGYVPRRPRRRSLRAPEMSPLAGAVAVGAAVAISGLVARLLHNRRSDEMDVEVELEDRTGYRPSAQPRTAYTSTPRSTGEMEVEVELESRGTTTSGYTAADAGTQRELDVEVDLEPRAGDPRPRSDDLGGSGTQSPPLM
ncbi:MAG TPA: hypothetical protein VF092_13820 [Longimicrobium sp.]